MMDAIGIQSSDELFAKVPSKVFNTAKLDLPDHQPEFAVEATIRGFANKNRAAGDGPFFVGAGAYRHHVPASVDHLIQRSEFLTAYTPYQPEISQGTLQMLFEFQTQVANLTGMEVANASMYDGSTATVEAVLMARRLKRRPGIVLSGGLHPQYRDTVATYMGDDEGFVCLPSDPTATEDIIAQIDDTTAAVVVQSPDFFGNLRDLRPIAEAAHEKGALLIAVFTEVISLGAIESPGAQGADIVVGEGQSIGVGLQFGGPYLGLFAVRDPKRPEYGTMTFTFTKDAKAPSGYTLYGWVALDSKNNRTSVRLANVKYNQPIAKSSFRWRDPRPKRRK
mgnify:CR=1 FL=1